MPITAIYKAIIKTFDAATYTATVQIVGSLPSYLAGVPVAHHLRANLLVPGAKCGVIFFDEANPTDAAVTLLFGGTPATADFDVDGNLNVDGLITLAGTVDGVDVSAHAHGGAGQGGAVGHASLSGVSADQHHAQSHTHSHDTELTGVSADDHHAQSHDHATIDLTGGQIGFPATQVPSSGVNVLDDYEEGTWTPSVGGNTTYYTQTGRYLKVGKLVFLYCDLRINVLGTGSPTTISGLPFTSATPADASAGSVGYYSSLATSVVFLVPVVNAGATTAKFESNAASATTITDSTVVFTNSTRIVWSIVYEASA